MSFCTESKFRNFIVATLLAAPFLLVSTVFSGFLFGVEGSPIAFGASNLPTLTDQRLIPIEAAYQVIDPGEADLTSNVSATSVTTEYPSPGLRGYPGPKILERLNLDPNIKASLKGELKNVFIQFEFAPGTTTKPVEIQLFALEGILDIIQNRIVGSAFSLQAVDENGDLVVSFKAGVIVTFVFGANGASAMAGIDDTLKLYQWDEDLGAWKAVPSVLNMEEGTITATINDPGEYAILRNSRVFIPSVY